MTMIPAPISVALAAVLLLCAATHAEAGTPDSGMVAIAAEYQIAGVDLSARGRFAESLAGLSFAAAIAELGEDSWLAIGARVAFALDAPFPSAFAFQIEPLATFEWLAMPPAKGGPAISLLTQIGPTFAWYDSQQLSETWSWLGAVATAGARLYVGDVMLYALVGYRYALATPDTSVYYSDALLTIGFGVWWD